ncbi:hypothetical protein Vretimale_18319, partial [Volvox reticuliferus]
SQSQHCTHAIIKPSSLHPRLLNPAPPRLHRIGMVVLAVQDARWLHGTGKFPGGCVEIKPSATDYIFVLEAAWERCWEKHRTDRAIYGAAGMVVLAVQDARWLHGTGKFPGGCVEIKPSATDYIFVLEAAWERCWEKHRTELSTVQQARWCWPYRMLDGFTALGSFPAAVWRSNRQRRITCLS